MKKIVLSAFMALSMVAMAQHVTPLSIQLTDVRLDSLRLLYQTEPTMYRASLEVVAQNLEKNAAELKAAKAELKVEQAHGKELSKSIKESQKMTSALKKLYTKEEGEVKSMQKTVEKSQKALAKQQGLNQETRDNYTLLLDRQQKELGYTIREIAERQNAITDLETSLRNSESRVQAYIQETEQKAAQLAELENQHKERTKIIKAEQKSAKSMQQ